MQEKSIWHYRKYYGIFRGGTKGRERDRGIDLGALGRNKHGKIEG